jgi:pyrroloquinoline-quinone synthase
MSTLVSSIDAEIEKRSLLKHPFYKSWSAGTLSREDLATYSREYFQLVKAVPELVRSANEFSMDGATREAVAEISIEETNHVELWTKFAAALGVPRDALVDPSGTTGTCSAVSQLRQVTEASLAQVAAVMYAIESEQPKISRTKLDGLKRFYGMDGSDDGTVYFREHEEADVRHAAVWREVLNRVGKSEQADALRAAVLSLETQNAVLDSVMDSCVRSTSS